MGVGSPDVAHCRANRSRMPRGFEENATVWPSGDQTGSDAPPGASVSRIGGSRSPSSQMSRRPVVLSVHSTATRSPLGANSGLRHSGGASSAPSSRPARSNHARRVCRLAQPAVEEHAGFGQRQRRRHRLTVVAEDADLDRDDRPGRLQRHPVQGLGLQPAVADPGDHVAGQHHVRAEVEQARAAACVELRQVGAGRSPWRRSRCDR